MNEPSDRRGGRQEKSRISGFLSNLARDTAGNTLAMMAIFAIPLAGLAGSAVDMSRMYLVKTRLQQACDAGVLAGRKVMTQTTGTTLATDADSAAQSFFKNNFPKGWMGATFPAAYSDGAGGGKLVTARTSDGQVQGTASVTVPMAIMGMFGVGSMTQTVNCTARLDVGDSDIMFVLDTTGSMACYTGSSCGSTAYDSTSKVYYRTEQATTYKTVSGNTVVDKQAKIDALRDAVKLFRTTLESNKPAAAHIRYGFVSYSSATNVGAVIRAKSNNYLADTSVFPSRELAINASGVFNSGGTSTTTLKLDEQPSGTNSLNYYTAQGNFNQGDLNYATGTAPTAQAATPTTRVDCFALGWRRFSNTGTTQQNPGTWPTNFPTVTVSRLYPIWNSSTSKCTTITWTVKPVWRYAQITRDVSSFKLGNAVDDPTKLATSMTTWQGCIVERKMTPATTSTVFDPKNLPADMNPDTMPTTEDLKWRPMWPENVYYRADASTYYYAGGNSTNAVSDTTSTTGGADYTSSLSTGSLSSQYYACGAPARTLAEMSETDFNNYLGSSTSGTFRPIGYTFHDVGMIWGLRLISPDGPWASTTAAWPGNNEPNRYIVFMTDGDMMAQKESYSMYGLNSIEAGVAAVNGTSDALHTKRFQAVCDAAKQKNIIVFVVQFDNGTTPSSDMTSCATESYAYAAQTPEQLQTAFSRIALEITRLRLAQ